MSGSAIPFAIGLETFCRLTYVYNNCMICMSGWDNIGMKRSVFNWIYFLILAVYMGRSALPFPRVLKEKFRADHPFMVALVLRQPGNFNVLFLGRLNQI